MLVRVVRSVNVRMWGKAVHSFRRGEVHRVPMAIAAVLFAQRFAEPLAEPPAVPAAKAA